MFKKRKLFYYTEGTVSYTEARGYRIKFAFGVLASAALSIGLLFAGNFFIGDVLGWDASRKQDEIGMALAEARGRK